MVNISSIKKEFISQFIPIFNYHHHAITGSQEVQVVYESHLFENNLLVLLQENINKDRVLHYTSGHSQRRPHLKSTVTPLKIWFSGTTEIFSDCFKTGSI
jgi:hypothetical protein